MNRGRILCLILAVLTLALLAAGSIVAAVGQPSERGEIIHAGGMACFSITPPDAPANRPGPHMPPSYPSCDQLCGAKKAACVATTSNMNPMRSCAATDYPPDSTLCRCCAVER